MIIETSGDTFAKNLVYLRKKYALSQRALAKLIGLHQSELAMIENGSAYPAMPVEAFRRTCEVFHIDTDTIAQIELTR